MDRAYTHFARLVKFTRAAAFFVVRPRGNLQYASVQQSPADWRLGVQCDEHIVLTGQHTKNDYPMVLRRIAFHDFQHDRPIVFLTNSFELSALQIAQLYKRRWQVELFFKWIKQNLRIKAFVGHSANAVKSQIWVAVTSYVLVAIIKKRLNISASLHSILQVLSLHLFESTPLRDLFNNLGKYDLAEPCEAQFSLFGDISGQ